MVSLEENLLAGQGSELETHVFLVRSSTTKHPHIFFALYNDDDKPWHKKHQQKKQINKIEQFLLNTNQQTCSS